MTRPFPIPDVVLKDVTYENEGEIITIPNQKAIVNPVTNHVFAVASGKYNLVTHQEVMENVEEVIERENSLGTFSKNISLDKHGGRMRTTYTFSDMSIPVGDNKDLINPSIEVFNSYDLSWRHSVMAGAFRVLCSNGLVVGNKYMNYRKKHNPDLYLQDVQRALQGGLEKMTEQSTLWKQWSEEDMNKTVTEKIIKESGLNNKETEALVSTKEASTGLTLDAFLNFENTVQTIMNKWIFFNIFTQFLTHQIKSESRRVQLENNLRKLIY